MTEDRRYYQWEPVQPACDFYRNDALGMVLPATDIQRMCQECQASRDAEHGPRLSDQFFAAVKPC